MYFEIKYILLKAARFGSLTVTLSVTLVKKELAQVGAIVVIINLF